MCSLHRPFLLYYLSNPLEKNGQNPTYPRNKSTNTEKCLLDWKLDFSFHLSKISFTEKIG